MKGFGTVVAGTVLSGMVKTGDSLELLPAKKQVKVRGIEVHNKKASEIGTGFRAAINLVGAEKDEIKRGDILAQIGYYKPSDYLNVSLYLLKSSGKPLKSFTRIRIHLGTKEILGRVVLLDKKILEPGEKAMAQFRLETPAVSDVGDRYVIRTYSPQTTIGGGIIIEPKAAKATGYDEELIEHLQKIEAGDPAVMVEEYLTSNFELPRKIDEIAYDLNLPQKEVNNLVEELINKEKALCIDKKRGLYYSQTNLEKLENKIKEILKEYHKNNPTDVGMPQLEMLKNISRGLDKSLLNYALKMMVQNKSIKSTGDKISLFDFGIILDKDLDAIVRKIEKIFLDAGYMPPNYDAVLSQRLGPENLVKKAYKYMLDSGVLINVGESVVLHQRLVKEAEKRLVRYLKNNNEIRVSEFRNMLGASRKFALPLLIYFDTHNVTIKRGDVRILGQKYR